MMIRYMNHRWGKMGFFKPPRRLASKSESVRSCPQKKMRQPAYIRLHGNRGIKTFITLLCTKRLTSQFLGVNSRASLSMTSKGMHVQVIAVQMFVCHHHIRGILLKFVLGTAAACNKMTAKIA